VSTSSSVQIGALVPLTRPGWVEAGRHLLAGLELAVRDVNDAGGIVGRPLELLVRDTAADPQRAAVAVDELADLGVAAVAGEYHSVAARAAAARADALGLPFLCSSAVLDALTEQPTEWVARLAPAQSQGWQIYADFLLGAGHSRIAVATEPSVYWASGARILRDHLAPRGGTVIELDVRALAPTGVCDELVDSRATAVLLLVGHPEPAASIVTSVRRDQRLAEVMIGAPAGQPEFAEWARLLGDDGAAIPFLRYLPERLGPLGARVETALRERLAEAPFFVAFEGYDTVAVLADVLRCGPGAHRRSLAARRSRRHAGADPVLPDARHQRLAMGSGADPSRRSRSGGPRPLPDPSRRLRAVTRSSRSNGSLRLGRWWTATGRPLTAGAGRTGRWARWSGRRPRSRDRPSRRATSRP
jgi:ABC-type branched-subunit amino acid transport system substrate-binding protein